MFQRYMLQVLHTGVAKVCRDVAYVAMVCTRMLQASVPNVSSVFSDVRCKCVYLDVAYVSHVYCKCLIWKLHMFTIVFRCFFTCFCKCFRHMFQVCFICFLSYVASIDLDVLKVDRMLQMGYAWEAGGSTKRRRRRATSKEHELSCG
jgi:hypothetical protein